MTATTISGVALAFVAMAFAGCTGSFDVDQTEPFRVQLEGAPETVTVRDTDTDAKRVVVETDCETTCDAEEVEVQFEVTRIDDGPCKVLVTIQDEDGNTIATRVIEVDVNIEDGDDGTSSSATGTGTNSTGNSTSATADGSTTASGQTVIQNLVVNVKGNKNIVVVTQAQQGAADIDIQAIKASGKADVDASQDTSVSSTASASATMTNTTG